MKRLLSITVAAIFLTLCLCGCNDNTQKTPLPEEYMTFYYLDKSVINDKSANLPRAENAEDGSPVSLGVWFDGSFDRGIKTTPWDDGYTIEELTDGKASGEFIGNAIAFDGKTYDAYKITAKSSYIPNVTPNEKGGILLLEISGDCHADGGAEDIDMFCGFDTVVITGGGTHTISGAGLSVGNDNLPLPTLIIDGANVICENIYLENTSEDIPSVLVISGKLEAFDVFSDNVSSLCVAGGEFSANTVHNFKTIVARGGVSKLYSVSIDEPCRITVSGGELSVEEWLPTGSEIFSGSGTIRAKGIKYWDTLHVYKGSVIDTAE